MDPDQTLELTKPAGHDTKEGPTKWDLINYQYDRKAYDDQVEALAKLNPKIFETIAETYRGYVRKDTVYQNLVNLKQNVSLNKAANRQVLRNEH